MKWILAAFAIFLSTLTLAETTLWKVSKDNNYLYLAGTVHLLSAKDLPFPSAFERAYEDSEIIACETDISMLSDPEIQFRLMSSLSYQDGSFLNKKISHSLYQKLNDYLVGRGLMPHIFLTMKPAGVMLTMMSVEFKRLGITHDGADSVYFKRAVKDGKPVLSLETIDTHINFIATMGEGNEEMFIQQTLEDLSKIEVMMDDIVTAWKSGNVNLLDKLVVADMRDHYPALYKTLLVERNNNWLPLVNKMARTPEIELILVGAAHLIGPDGLLDLLQHQGYSIQQM
ncbi:MAG: TraB/GumN family protein [Neptuniibacter sp.]